MFKDYSNKYLDDYFSLFKNFEVIKCCCYKVIFVYLVCVLNFFFFFIEECLEILGIDLKILISNLKFKYYICFEYDKMKIELKLFEIFFWLVCSGIIK